MEKNYTPTLFCKPGKKRRAWRVCTCTLLLLVMELPAWNFAAHAQQTNRFSLNLRRESVLNALREINRISGNTVVFKREEVERVSALVTVNLTNVTVLEAVRACIENTDLSCEVYEGNVVVVPGRRERNKIITGSVVDARGEPLPGASIRVKSDVVQLGASTDADGRFRLGLPVNQNTLIVSFVGYEPREVDITGQTTIRVVMQELVQDMGEVIVNGVFTRKAESYTGASRTLTASDLARVGNRNVFQSLKNLDPSLQFIDNLDLGSNPNAMPQLQMRGITSFPADETGVALKGNYLNKPNQPLFILDGFEASIERIFDLDMNRIESITLLKDAAAKALYGSKAANGVVVIETKRLAGNEQRVTYTGNLTLEMPDLTSYNLTNAREKLEAEVIDGRYTDTDMDYQIDLWNLYNERKKRVLEGLDTYWLAKPLRTGVGQKHGLSVEVGDSRSLRTVLDISYNNVSGVMKGSYRNTITGSVNVSYRVKNLLFRNTMNIANMKNEESPYGNFSKYAELNPYWYATDPETGAVLRWAEFSIANRRYIPNPMYDALIGTLNKETYLDFVNNFYVEWQINEHLKTTGRVGVSNKRSDWEEFLPADHSTFSTLSISAIESEKLRRGSYTFENGKGSSLSADVNVNYNRTVGKHDLFFNAGAFLSESSSGSKRVMAEGFPGNMGADLTFARDYARDTRPTSYTTIQREVSFLGTVSYSYANRYLAELTARVGGSSLYGKNNRWSSGWSVGAGWNLHQESFLSGIEALERLKLRASVGVTGNQNFNTNASIATYTYYTNALYHSMVGARLAALANPGLGWEQREDYNVGADIQVGGLTAVLEWYKGITRNAVADLATLQSTGFHSVKDNLGLVINTGVELTLGYSILQGRDGFLNLFGSVVTEKNTLERVSDAMRAYNEAREQMAADKGNPKPVLMYKDGQAMRTIWAVPSLGIDPMNGAEVYRKQDGTLTYTYSPLDLVAAGDETPAYRGNAGFTARYKGIELSVTCSFLGGCEMYNSTLVDRVENVDIDLNVDRRVLLGRWREPGHQAQFKRLGTFRYEDDAMNYQEKTRATTRFVQERSEFDISTMSLSYELPVALTRKFSVERLKLAFYMNDVAKWSSIKIERGLSYPYAHVASFSLMATF
ncbi:MAG: SusC/RagA family TonB-linked outer membrane protein [Odoribacteraceae bacterium]|jgi:TonB-linked SusC/RagA family outer membrane protein|nr:SusC/RagA family TonB-linked outer membrane protein [Odoribacteraceae bacterium]